MIKIDELRTNLVNKNAKWVAKANPILALSEAERKLRLGLVVDEQKRLQEAATGSLNLGGGAAAAPLVQSVDWRNHNGQNHVTAVKDQGGCGSCVSFCVVATLESMISIERGRTQDLSEADLHFCSSHGAGCNGWWPGDAIGQVKSRGVTAETEFPYSSAFTGGLPHCTLSIHRDINAVRLIGSEFLWTVHDRKWWLANVGPVCASFQVFEDFYAYGSGVYEHVMGPSEGFHCVEVVGYSDIEGCWICKNSWGMGWGDNGFFKIAYGQCRIDPGSIQNPSAFAMNGMKGVVLLPEFKVQSQFSKASPAIAVFNGRLHMVHLGKGSNNIWHSVNDGNTWTPNVTIPNQKSKAAPALAVYGGELHLLHLDNSSNDIWHSKYLSDIAGGDWEPNWKIQGQKSKASPAIIQFGNVLHMVHLGDGSNDIWHSFFPTGQPGSGWSQNVKINRKSKATPALAVFGGVMHMVHLGDSSNNIWHSTFNGSQWSPDVKIPSQKSKSSPALAVFGGKLHMVHLDDSSNDIWHSSFNGSSWSPNVRLPLPKSRASPALADFAGHLQMLHIGSSTNQIWQGWIE